MKFKKRINGSWTDIPHYIHNTDTDTITTLPTAIYPTGTTATVGLKGQTVQSSIPSPTSPVMPQGTGERAGNLFSGDFSQFDNVGGTGDIYTYFYIPEDFTLTLVAKDTHTIPDNIFLGITKDGGQSTGGFTWAIPQRKNITKGDVFTVKSSTSGYHYVSMYRKITSVFNWILEHYYVMLNLGSTPLPYEPYGYKIPISSANTTTPVYLGEVQTTRKVKKLVLTGQGTRWYKSGAYQGSFYLGGVSPEPISLTEQAYCSHAEFTSISTYAKNKFCFNGSPINLNLWIGESSWTTDDFNAYLAQQYIAGTPVTIWYVLAEPETAIVNEPLMKIGEYADEVSGISIPTTAGANTLSVGTTLQPSEVTVNYKGWHPITNVHERNNGAWN